MYITFQTKQSVSKQKYATGHSWEGMSTPERNTVHTKAFPDPEQNKKPQKGFLSNYVGRRRSQAHLETSKL